MFLNPLVLLLLICIIVSLVIGFYEIALGVILSLVSLAAELLFIRYLTRKSSQDFIEDHPKLESLFRDDKRASQKKTRGQLASQLYQLSINLVIISYSMVTLSTIIGIIQQQSSLVLVHNAILMTIILIPEGLPVAFEAILSFGLLRMNHSRVAIENIQALEVLTFASVIVIKVNDVNHVIDNQIKTILDTLHQQFKIDIKILTDSPLCLESVLNSSSLSVAEPSVISSIGIGGLFNSKTELLLRVDDIETNSIFYSLNPARKASLVNKLQQLNKVVVVIGRGPNDAFCMEQADFGLAMGGQINIGYRVAEMVVLDDNLDCLLEAIIESRSIYCKLRGFVCYQTSITTSLLILISLCNLANLEIPFNSYQLLFINVLADGLSGQILCAEKIEPEVLSNRGARQFNDSILDWRSILVIISLTLLILLINGGLYYLQLDATGALKKRANILIFTCYIISTAVIGILLRLSFVKKILSY